MTASHLSVQKRDHHGEMAYLSLDLLCNVLVISVAVKLGVISVVPHYLYLVHYRHL